MENKKVNKYGLTDRDINTILKILSNYPEVETVNIFGSRATGSYEQGSDIDLAIMNAIADNKIISELLIW